MYIVKQLNLMKIEDLIDLIELQLGKRHVKSSDHFINDLNAESLDMVNLAAAIEDRFGIVIPEAGLVQTQTVEELFELMKSQSPN